VFGGGVLGPAAGARLRGDVAQPLPDPHDGAVRAIPGVRERRIYDDDSDDNYELLNAQAAAAARMEAGVCCRELTATRKQRKTPVAVPRG
jgi:hypothetical protein